LLNPSQLSATSQSPATPRHSAVLLTSAGHVGPFPGQVSAGSQIPAEARHSTLEDLKASAGQSLLTPSQVSARSQPPGAGRQTPLLFASAGQVPLAPVQVSAGSQVPPDARHCVVPETNVQVTVQQKAGLPLFPPWSQSSPASSVPFPHGTIGP
jgi:hypothetical protein